MVFSSANDSIRNYVDVCSATSCDLSSRIFSPHPPLFPHTTGSPPSFGSSPPLPTVLLPRQHRTAAAPRPPRQPKAAGHVRHGARWDSATRMPFSASPGSAALGAPSLPFTYPQPRQRAARRGTSGRKNGPRTNEGGRRPAASAPERTPAHRPRKGPRSAAHRSRVTSAGGPLLSLPAAGMPKLSKEAKQRLQQLFKGGQFAIRWGFIPVVLYLGQ